MLLEKKVDLVPVKSVPSQHGDEISSERSREVRWTPSPWLYSATKLR